MIEQLHLLNTSGCLQDWLSRYLILPYHEYAEGDYEPDISALSKLLNKTRTDHKYRMLADTKGRFHGIFLQRAAYYKHCKVLSCILKYVSEDQRIQLLKIQDEDGRTGLHKAAWKDFPEAMSIMLHSVSESNRFEILQLSTSNGWTPLHWAAVNGSAAMISVILQAMTDATKCFELISKQADGGQTALHGAVSGVVFGDSKQRNSNQTVCALLDPLTASLRLDLMRIQDRNGKTALHISEDHREAREALRQYKEHCEAECGQGKLLSTFILTEAHPRPHTFHQAEIFSQPQVQQMRT